MSNENANNGELNLTTPPTFPATGWEQPPAAPPSDPPPADTPPADNKKDKTPLEPWKDNPDDEPPVRKNKLDYILARKQAKIDKLEKKVADKKDDKGDDDDDEDNTYDDDISPEDEALVEKVLSKKFWKHFAVIEDSVFKSEMTQFLTANPQFKPYEAKIEKWAKHSSYSNLPLEQVAFAACGADLLKLWADKARQADKEKEASKTWGAAKWADVPKKWIWDMTDAEFQAEQTRVRMSGGW